jgi:hypothetical protein
MKTSRHLFLRISLFMLLPILAAASPAPEFEKPPTLPAHVLAPASLLSGDGFHVNDEVSTEGYLGHFTIHSDVGTFKAGSVEMLRIRVAELPAIVELTKTSKTKVFAQALATNAAAPVAAAGQMVMHPVETVRGLPSGVGRFFGRVGLGAERLKEAATESQGASAGEKAGNLATHTAQTTRDILGYEQERRGLAKKLHVDPYTTNPVLSKQLDDFATVAFRAHVGVTTTMSVFIPGSMAITATRVVSAWVWDTPRADLIVQDEKGLRQLKVPEKDIHTFMRNPVFPLSVQTAFITNLERLSGVPGSVDAVILASTAESEQQARFLTNAVGMLARYHETQTPIVKIVVRKTIVGKDRNGAVVLEAPVDYIPWTEQASYFAHRPDLQTSRRTIWLTGQFSPLARKNFQALGWTINEKVSPIPESHAGL